MLDKLPEIFGRDFAVGYLLPGIFLVVGSYFLWKNAGELPATLVLSLEQDSGRVNELDLLAGAVVVGLIAWTVGVFLLALNRTFVRTIEGYGRANPLKLFRSIEVFWHRKFTEEIKLLRVEQKSAGENFAPKAQNRLQRKSKYFADHFPPHEGLVLATRFGNTLRAYEAYSVTMYSFDINPGWARLTAFVPEDYRKLMDSAKAIVDFWINLIIVVFLLAGQFTAFQAAQFEGIKSLYSQWPRSLVWVLMFSTLIWFLYNRAISAAVQRGAYYKAAVDVFLPLLLERVRGTDERKTTDSRDFWFRFSQATGYHSREPLRSEMQKAEE